jgi:hypothetical protein
MSRRKYHNAAIRRQFGAVAASMQFDLCHIRFTGSLLVFHYCVILMVYTVREIFLHQQACVCRPA